jgi:phosphoenolpyruvate carboxykinase (GTP)
VPLIHQAYDWQHGVFLGSIMSSETTAAAEGPTRLRRDPFAMLPFCGYNMADYFAHWLKIGRASDPGKLPKIFYVNWFRRGDEGTFLWPGFGENSRILKWALQRIDGTADAVRTPIGDVPTPDDLDLDGLAGFSSSAATAAALHVEPAEWRAETALIEQWYAKIGDRLPRALREELAALGSRLGIPRFGRQG